MPSISRLLRDGDAFKLALDAGPDPRHGTRLELETVLVPMRSYHGHRWYTVCVSSQVGCRMACTFCETARMGLRRNLSAAEIVAQVDVAREVLGDERPDASVRNVVFMGMGEPLDNLDAVLDAVAELSRSRHAAIPPSRITISTVGRVKGLARIAALGRPGPRIAVSLNAADDALRDHLMPVNRGTPLAVLQDALCRYPLPRRGRFLIEYVLLAGVNDSPGDARRVAEWCRPLPCMVNLIPYNPQHPPRYRAPDEATVLAFLRDLRERGIFAKRRTTHGDALMAACGQLGHEAVDCRL